jgi:tetratricopeptide (TPR) repeat protein
MHVLTGLQDRIRLTDARADMWTTRFIASCLLYTDKWLVYKQGLVIPHIAVDLLLIESNMYSKLISWSRYTFLAGIVLALVLVIPTAWFPFQLAKVAVFAVCMAVAAILFVLGRGTREVVRSRGFYGVLLMALLPLAYVISAFFSVDRSVGFTGFGVESDTVLFTTLLFLAFAVSFALFRTLRTVRMLLTVVFWALVAAAIFQFISIVFGSAAIPLATFADRSVNLIGKWNDLGIIAGLLSMLLLVRVELTGLSNAWRIVVGIALAGLAVLLGIINFSLVWGLVLAFSVVLAVVQFLLQRSGALADAAPAHWMRRLPWFSIAAALVSILFLFFGSSLNTNLTNLFPVSSLEVRPSYSSTLTIIDAARAGSFQHMLLGTGPNTFGEEWLLHKPAEVNQSSFWNLDFNVGFSTFITALGTVGLLGVLAWLIPFILVLASLVRAVRFGVLNHEDKIIATTLGIASLFLLSSIFLYAPSQNIILLAIVFSGVTFGFLWRQGQSAPNSEEPATRVGAALVLIAMVVIVVLVSWSGIATGRRLIAEAYTGAGTQALSNGDTTGALNDATFAQKVDGNGDVLRLLVSVYSVQLQQLAASTSTPAADVQSQFTGVVQSAITTSQAAEKLNPADYRPTLALGQIYDFLSSLKVQGAAQTALNTYQQAAAEDPTNPTIPLTIARLAAAQGNQQITTAFLTQALTLKPNYTDAILMVVQLDVTNKDIPNAIKAATAAAQTAPGDAPIWFELGLLYYSAGDATHAAQALQQAVTIQPNYANAQYFLGLSYYILKDNADAIKQFEALAQSNPGNTEVTLILSNLQAGKQPFDGAQPPVTATPQARSTAPVAQ